MSTVCTIYPQKIKSLNSLENFTVKMVQYCPYNTRLPFRRLFSATYKIVSVFKYSECDFPSLRSPKVQFSKAQGKVVELLLSKMSKQMIYKQNTSKESAWSRGGKPCRELSCLSRMDHLFCW